jgi:hypothetical protein
MLKTNKKMVTIDKIMRKKFKDLQVLHEFLKENNIYFEYTVTTMKITFYLLRINNTNYARKLCIDNKNRYYFAQ